MDQNNKASDDGDASQPSMYMLTGQISRIPRFENIIYFNWIFVSVSPILRLLFYGLGV